MIYEYFLSNVQLLANELKITLKIIKTILPVCDVKNLYKAFHQ